MPHLRRISLSACYALSLVLLAACGPATDVEPAVHTPAAGEAAASATPSLEPMATLTPTVDLKLAATPTVPPQWFDPGRALEESDYLYYDQLLLAAEDSTPTGRVTGGGGVSMSPCDTCDLVALRYVYASYLPEDLRVTFLVFLYRHTGLDVARAALEQHIGESLGLGSVILPTPAGVQLPPGSAVLVHGGNVGIMTIHEAFEIHLLPDQLPSLAEDQMALFMAELAELQIAKLVAAGY